MKYIFFYFLACTAILTGCTKKTDEIFDKSVDERLSETLTNYQNALTSAPGWKLFVYPKGLESQDIKVGGLTYYVKFTSTNRVSMVSDFSTDIAETPKESGYHLKALQRPSLIFDTYSYMHIPADPDPDVSFSPTGTGGNGWGTDFNFSFTQVAPGDTIQLEGNFNRSRAVLVKATQAEMDAAFKNGRLKEILELTYDYQESNPFIYFTANAGMNVSVGFDFNNIMMTFTYLEGGNLVNKTQPFSFTTYGIHLGSPATIGNYTFQDIFWDDVKNLYYITSGATRVEFKTGTTPIVSAPITSAIGSEYTTISIPPGAGLPNESPLFITKYNTTRTGMLTGGYNLRMDDMDFVFNAGLKTMNVNIYAFQGAVGPYLCQYSFSYTVDANGLFNFTKTSQNGNAALIVGAVNNILSYIENDEFTINGFSTSSSFLGQLTSKQNADFYFTGYLY